MQDVVKCNILLCRCLKEETWFCVFAFLVFFFQAQCARYIGK